MIKEKYVIEISKLKNSDGIVFLIVENNRTQKIRPFGDVLYVEIEIDALYTQKTTTNFAHNDFRHRQATFFMKIFARKVSS